MKRILTLTALLAATNLLAADMPLFRDPAKPVEERVQDLISRLTLEEKAVLLDHKGPTIERFGIRSDQWNQCLNGVKWDRPTTLFPICLAMAASWDTNLVREIATVLSDEARAIYNGWHLDPNAPGEHKGLIYRAPVINIGRNPYWGRNHEAWGEDPYLTGRMGVAYVRGLQGDDPRHLKIAATLKHYAVNNVETDRTALNAVVPEAMLRDYWLPHFRDAVVEGRAESLMASYNAINGTPNNINRWLLTDVLKNEWRHDGFVVSDLGGVRTMVTGHGKGKITYVDAVAQSVMAGCDFSDKEYRENIPAAVREGKLTEARLNDAVSRVLKVRFRLGEFDAFDAVPYSKISPDVVCSAKHRAVALKAAQECIVLLQNRDHLLPLDKSKLKRIAVLGPLADRLVLNNYNGKPGVIVTALQGIKDRVGAAVEVLHAKGCEFAGGPVATKIEKNEGFSGGASVKLDAQAVGQFIEFAVPLPDVDVYELKLDYKSFPSRGIYQLSIDGVPQGQPVDLHNAKGGYGQSVTFGSKRLNAGKRTLRFTVVGKNTASPGFSGHFDKLTLIGKNTLTFECESLKRTTGGGHEPGNIAGAAELARGADVAILCIGTDTTVEHEGRDRKQLGLTGAQEELVKAVLAANPRTIVVQMSAGPLTVPWLKYNAPAMLQAWWSGEEGGHAIADVIFGDVNPAGRLPHTVYASESQVPPLDEYDISQGFTYMYVKGEPLYAFGHGLSYTTFEYSNIGASGNPLTVTANVKNTGTRAGDEVAQLYLVPPQSGTPRPRLMLRGFQRVSLQPDESKQVTFTVPDEKLAFWNSDAKRFDVQHGDWGVQVGASSSDIRLQTKVAK
ncbi:MAG: glycoside hydrolase family 3 C-terminal domain-containing protein [Verrucomicrobiota bacterium]